MGVLVTCKNEEDPFKNEGARVHCKSMQIFYGAQGKLTPQYEVGSTLNSNSSKLFMVVLVTYKNEEDPI